MTITVQVRKSVHVCVCKCVCAYGSSSGGGGVFYAEKRAGGHNIDHKTVPPLRRARRFATPSTQTPPPGTTDNHSPRASAAVATTLRVLPLPLFLSLTSSFTLSRDDSRCVEISSPESAQRILEVSRPFESAAFFILYRTG